MTVQSTTWLNAEVHTETTQQQKVKEQSVQLAQLLSSNHRVVLPWCTQAVVFIEIYQWTMLTAEASMFYLQSIILSETFCGKNAGAAENDRIFQLVSVFQKLSPTSDSHVQLPKLLQSRPESAVDTRVTSAFELALFWQ
jgi:hypothetical protein